MGIAHLRLPRLVSISRASKCCPDILLKQAPFFLSHRVRLAASQHHGNTGSRFPRQAFGHAAEIRNAGHHEPSQEQDVPHSLHRLSSTNMLSPRLRGAIASRHRTKGNAPRPNLSRSTLRIVALDRHSCRIPECAAFSPHVGRAAGRGRSASRPGKPHCAARQLALSCPWTQAKRASESERQDVSECSRAGVHMERKGRGIRPASGPVARPDACAKSARVPPIVQPDH